MFLFCTGLDTLCRPRLGFVSSFSPPPSSSPFSSLFPTSLSIFSFQLCKDVNTTLSSRAVSGREGHGLPSSALESEALISAFLLSGHHWSFPPPVPPVLSGELPPNLSWIRGPVLPPGCSSRSRGSLGSTASGHCLGPLPRLPAVLGLGCYFVCVLVRHQPTPLSSLLPVSLAENVVFLSESTAHHPWQSGSM